MPPPGQQPNAQSAPWLYQPGQQQQGQIQVQTQIHYHTQQLHYQNGQMQAQLHYTVQPPPPIQQPFEVHKAEAMEQQKCQGLKRRFADVEGPQVRRVL